MNPALGTLSTSGVYLAPAVSAAQTVTITATAGVAVGVATVTVLPPVSVAVTPLTAALAAGQTVQFTAAVAQTSNTAVNWTERFPEEEQLG